MQYKFIEIEHSLFYYFATDLTLNIKDAVSITPDLFRIGKAEYDAVNFINHNDLEQYLNTRDKKHPDHGMCGIIRITETPNRPSVSVLSLTYTVIDKEPLYATIIKCNGDVVRTMGLIGLHCGPIPGVDAPNSQPRPIMTQPCAAATDYGPYGPIHNPQQHHGFMSPMDSIPGDNYQPLQKT